MSPYHNARYANFLYQTGMIDEIIRDECLVMEAETQALIEAGQMVEAFKSWGNERSYLRGKMGCSYPYNIALCNSDPVEDNYEEFLNWESSR